MLDRFIRLMVWWFRKWYPVFRSLGEKMGREEYVETAIKVSEENFENTADALGIELGGYDE
ncbi:hypothetical protein [Natrarchaeobius oligotrophus]|uniref:Uncharacterized protein n=1 Tax=Natrarchaeobius chitinivorans TaxID=1679083 RepID=A0A3N6MC64_NATCH|nr:hypothetical protein [Natrarchaeobius chitinivorans]RQG98304.1 hypothetical protein EA472_17990 [Natrarchaeobius chitinivorans]